MTRISQVSACRPPGRRGVAGRTPNERPSTWCGPASDHCRAPRRRTRVRPGRAPRPRRPPASLPGFAQRLWSARSCPPNRVFLTPFDNLIRDRDRTRRLFGFDYTFEAYKPPVRPLRHPVCRPEQA
ncbi:crosslink repair DNA glycosylase YcaQ family protein [Nonomuraea sp. NPDC049607]